jgi:hypothetical protein
MPVGSGSLPLQAEAVAAAVIKALKNSDCVEAPVEAAIEDPAGQGLCALFDRLTEDKAKVVFKTRKAGQALVEWLRFHGEIYIDRKMSEEENLFWLDKRNGRTRLRCMQGQEFDAFLAGRCGRNSDDKSFKDAKDWVFTSALDPESGTATCVEISQHWATRGYGNDTVFYISNGYQLVKGTSKGVAIVPMGTDGVLMPEAFALPEWTLAGTESLGVGPGELSLIRESGLDHNGLHVFTLYLTILWLIPPGEIPPLAIEGPSGSGKTTLLTEAARLFFGPEYNPISPVGEDADKAIPRLLNLNRLVVWDNLDDPRGLRGFAERLSASTTGAASAEKMHYKNGKVVNLPVKAAQMLSSLNMDFILRCPTAASRLLNLSWEMPRSNFDKPKVVEEARSKRSDVLSFIAHIASRTIAQYDPAEKCDFRFDYWQRIYNACARALDCEEKAKDSLCAVLGQSQERGTSADTYGALLLQALSPGELVRGTAGKIFESIKTISSEEQNISPQGLSSWLRKAAPVARGFKIKQHYDRYLKQWVFDVSRDANSI